MKEESEEIMVDTYGKGRGRHKKGCDCIRCSERRRAKMEEESKQLEEESVG